MKIMDIKVIHAGNCMICGREIKVVAKREKNKFPNVFFCPKCEERIIKRDKPQTESEEEKDG